MTQRYNLRLVKSTALGDVDFSSSDPDIASVTLKGSTLTVVPIKGKTGETTITVSADGMSSSSTITTIDLAKDFSLTDRRNGTVYTPSSPPMGLNPFDSPKAGDRWTFDVAGTGKGVLLLGFFWWQPRSSNF